MAGLVDIMQLIKDGSNGYVKCSECFKPQNSSKFLGNMCTNIQMIIFHLLIIKTPKTYWQQGASQVHNVEPVCKTVGQGLQHGLYLTFNDPALLIISGSDAYNHT